MYSLLLISGLILSTIAVPAPEAVAPAKPADPNEISPVPAKGYKCTDERPFLANGKCMPVVYDYCPNQQFDDRGKSNLHTETPDSLSHLLVECSESDTCFQAIYYQTGNRGYISTGMEGTGFYGNGPHASAAIKRLKNPTKAEFAAISGSATYCPLAGACTVDTCETSKFYSNQCVETAEKSKLKKSDCIHCPDPLAKSCAKFTGNSESCQFWFTVGTYGRCVSFWDFWGWYGWY